VELPFGKSIYDLKQAFPPAARDLIVREDGLRLLGNAAVLVNVSATTYRTNPIEARIVLESVRDASDTLARLLDGGHSTVAGRVAGAFRNVNRADIADEIMRRMKAAGYDVHEINPFPGEPQAVMQVYSL
jgi:hypothetical protein